MVSTCPAEIGGWSEDGDSFVIHDPETFTREIIPTVYKHSNWSSFVRQLNFYGFRKVRLRGNTSAAKFEHPLFKRGQPQLISLIKKASERGFRFYIRIWKVHLVLLESASSASASENSSESTSLRADLEQLKIRVSEMADTVAQLQTTVSFLASQFNIAN